MWEPLWIREHLKVVFFPYSISVGGGNVPWCTSGLQYWREMEATSGPCRVGRLSVGMLQAYCLLTLWDFTALCRQPTANPQCRPRCLLHFTSALGPTVGRLLWLYTTSKQTCILGIINGFLHKFHRKFFCFCGNSKLLCSCGFIYVWVALNLMAVQSASNTYYSTPRITFLFKLTTPRHHLLLVLFPYTSDAPRRDRQLHLVPRPGLLLSFISFNTEVRVLYFPHCQSVMQSACLSSCNKFMP